MFGFNTQVRNNIHWVDEQTLAFVAGMNLVLYNVETKTEKFYCISEMDEVTAALSISSNKKHLAIAQISHNKLSISVYDVLTWRLRKAIPFTEDCMEFWDMAISQDGKYIVFHSGSPDFSLYYISVEKSKVLALIKTTSEDVQQVTIDPSDNTHICVTGRQSLKKYRYAEGQLKQISFKAEQKVEVFLIQNWVCHCWFEDGSLCASSEDCKISIFEYGEHKIDIPVNYGPQFSPRIVKSMIYTSKGLICGTTSGCLMVYEKREDIREGLKKVREISLGEESSVSNLSCTSNEEILICSLESGSIFQITVDSLKSEDFKLMPVPLNFHSGAVNGMSVCIRKPLLVTCGADKYIRIWNFIENSLEVGKQFAEDICGISIHPSGLYVLVGFSDKLRLMNILVDDIRSFREFPIRACKEIKFSHGGQYFAIIHGNTIQIYNTWTFELL